ncbi:hypothetical protein NDN08_000279 [Rhodosorus marinus]|uniref:Uncharacterized protein n=1 Tax=Rhodosorus marinus TaxID=101924 RepID=A0AAV8UIH1_9RHOD|nr:hypothetical protein NDN08_000279 [Rhodosorus marinus]
MALNASFASSNGSVTSFHSIPGSSVVGDVISEYSVEDTDFEDLLGDSERNGSTDGERYADLDERSLADEGSERRASSSLSRRSSSKKRGQSKLVYGLRGHGLQEKTLRVKRINEFRTELMSLFKEMNRLIGFEVSQFRSVRGTASREILRMELGMLAMKLAQMDSRERVPSLRELLRRRKDQENEIENLEVKLATLLYPGSRRGSVEHKRFKLQRVLDVLDSELDHAKVEKEETRGLLVRKTAELKHMDARNEALNRSLIDLEVQASRELRSPTPDIVRLKVLEHDNEKAELEAELMRLTKAMGGVRIKLLNTKHRIADKEAVAASARHQQQSVIARTLELRSETSEDREQLMGQIQDLYEVQKATIADVKDLYGEKAGGSLERLVDRNEKVQRGFLRIFKKAWLPKMSASHRNNWVEYVGDTSTEHDSAPRSSNPSGVFPSKYHTSELTREGSASVVDVTTSGEEGSPEGENSTKRNEDRSLPARVEKVAREDSKRLYDRSVLRVRSKEIRSLDFLDSCIKQRERSITELEKRSEELDLYLKSLNAELETAEEEKNGRLIVKNFNRMGEELAQVELERYSVRLGQYSNSLFV